MMFENKEKLIEFLVKDWEYVPHQAPENAEQLINMDTSIRKAFEKWLANGEFPDTPVFSGLSPRSLSKLANFKPPAVFLLLDWIKREPKEAFSALEREFGKSFRSKL